MTLVEVFLSLLRNNIYTFSNYISPKVKLIAWLEFELTITSQSKNVNHSDTILLKNIFFVLKQISVFHDILQNRQIWYISFS